MVAMRRRPTYIGDLDVSGRVPTTDPRQHLFLLYTYPYFPFTRRRHNVFSMCDTFSDSTYTHMISKKAGSWMVGGWDFGIMELQGQLDSFLALYELTLI